MTSESLWVGCYRISSLAYEAIEPITQHQRDEARPNSGRLARDDAGLEKARLPGAATFPTHRHPLPSLK